MSNFEIFQRENRTLFLTRDTLSSGKMAPTIDIWETHPVRIHCDDDSIIWIGEDTGRLAVMLRDECYFNFNVVPDRDDQIIRIGKL